jgi:predicted nucleic acid-binding protein
MLLLDSEVLSSIAQGPAAPRDQVRALIHEMRRRELPIATVAAVLAEVVRGRPAGAAVLGELRREGVLVHPVDTAAGVRAGRLLGAARRGFGHAVDAFLVAIADLGGGAVIATVDVDDLGELAAHAKDVVVASIQAGHR